ncbi:zinc-dependent alcohol dehydrogenase [Psychromicrobium xiongbiense]|uniref:zinc-dependent alcohol dehydrogenase n=1 Tax=Psychromicrobium xiongbiense TaxID=3051184 RepID=UPI0025562C6F|nr:alcohol dehydrogenase catalytic domain-containing protein [Psychromicrobium sp. YIM S02556]
MSTETVRRVVVNAADDVVIEQVERPVAGEGEVLVRSTVVGICGSDMHAAHGRHPFMSLPFRPGHEVVGVIEAVGPEVDSSLLGQRIVVEPNLPCGHCEQCQEGRYNICSTLEVFGCQTPGGMADVFTIAADRVVPLPDDLEDQWAALIEPFSTPMHAVRRAGDLRGRRVVVIGAGPIGLFTMIAALHAGAERVVVADLLESKRERAVRLGACGAFDPTADDAAQQARAALGGDAHVVFDCVSRESTVHLAIEVLSKGGSLMTIGVPAGRTVVDLDLVQDRELQILGNLMFVRSDVLASIELLSTKPFPFEELVTGTFSLADAALAFQASDDPEQVKVLVTVEP